MAALRGLRSCLGRGNSLASCLAYSTFLCGSVSASICCLKTLTTSVRLLLPIIVSSPVNGAEFPYRQTQVDWNPAEASDPKIHEAAYHRLCALQPLGVG